MWWSCKRFWFWSKLEVQRPTYWSPDASYLRYLTLAQIIDHPHLIHIDVIVGNTVQPYDNIVSTPFLNLWVPKSLVSNPISYDTTSYTSMILRNGCEYHLYWFFPSNNAVFDFKVCGNENFILLFLTTDIYLDEKDMCTHSISSYVWCQKWQDTFFITTHFEIKHCIIWGGNQ